MSNVICKFTTNSQIAFVSVLDSRITEKNNYTLNVSMVKYLEAFPTNMFGLHEVSKFNCCDLLPTVFGRQILFPIRNLKHCYLNMNFLIFYLQFAIFHKDKIYPLYSS